MSEDQIDQSNCLKNIPFVFKQICLPLFIISIYNLIFIGEGAYRPKFSVCFHITHPYYKNYGRD